MRRYYRLWIFLLPLLRGRTPDFLRDCSSLPHSWRDLRLSSTWLAVTSVVLINIKSWFEEVRVLSFRFIISTFHIATSSSGTIVLTVKPEVKLRPMVNLDLLITLVC